MCRRCARLRATWRFVPSIRDRINLAKLYRHALRALPETVDGQAPLPVSETCPVTLDELLSDEPGRGPGLQFGQFGYGIMPALWSAATVGRLAVAQLRPARDMIGP